MVFTGFQVKLQAMSLLQWSATSMLTTSTTNSLIDTKERHHNVDAPLPESKPAEEQKQPLLRRTTYDIICRGDMLRSNHFALTLLRAE